MRRKSPQRRRAQGIFHDEPFLKPLDECEVLEVALPDDEDLPARLPQSRLVPLVPDLGFPDLLPPPIRPRFREPEVLAVLMPVPVATVDEDDGVVLREDDDQRTPNVQF